MSWRRWTESLKRKEHDVQMMQLECYSVGDIQRNHCPMGRGMKHLETDILKMEIQVSAGEVMSEQQDPLLPSLPANPVECFPHLGHFVPAPSCVLLAAWCVDWSPGRSLGEVFSDSWWEELVPVSSVLYCWVWSGHPGWNHLQMPVDG